MGPVGGHGHGDGGEVCEEAGLKRITRVQAALRLRETSVTHSQNPRDRKSRDRVWMSQQPEDREGVKLTTRMKKQQKRWLQLVATATRGVVFPAPTCLQNLQVIHGHLQELRLVQLSRSLQGR